MAKFILENGTHKRQHRMTFLELLSNTVGIIRVATAYVTERQLLSSATVRERRLLTSLAKMDIVSGATSLDALAALISTGVECRILPERPRLHAKVYIFGSSHAVVTSANLTENAFNSNIEVGVAVTGPETNRLSGWFDNLWDLADPLKIDQLSEIQRSTSVLQREFAKLKREANTKTTSLRKAYSQTGLSDSLQHLFAKSKRFFVCNTDRKQGDRTPTGGFILEEEMHTRGFATAWEDFKFPSHMEMVEPGNAIFMFAKRVGIIGVGVAEASHETLSPYERGRITHVHRTVEWRVPVRWLAWTDANGAYPWNAPNFTFCDVTKSRYDDFRADVIAYFLGNT